MFIKRLSIVRALVVALVFVLALILSSCAPAVQGFVELPDETKGRITALVVAVVGFGLAKLIEMVPFLTFLEEFRLPFSLALAAELINWIQNAVPDAFAGVAVAAITLALELIALLLVFARLKERGVRLFK